MRMAVTGDAGDGRVVVVTGADLPDDGPTGTFTRDGRPVPW